MTTEDDLERRLEGLAQIVAALAAKEAEADTIRAKRDAQITELSALRDPENPRRRLVPQTRLVNITDLTRDRILQITKAARPAPNRRPGSA